MSKLFSPLTIRKIKTKNRVYVSPMCQYSAKNGVAQPWHLVHLGGFAKGGAGLVMAEATAVSPEGRISLDDLGIWNDEQAEALKSVTDFIHSQGAVSSIQLAHAGRKASTHVPWMGNGVIPESEGGWQSIGPSAISFSENYRVPKEMSKADIERVAVCFEEATVRSLQSGFQVIELHMAHGYLLHEFLSPISNTRQDEYGGSLENRMRFPLQVAKRVRAVIPNDLPLFVRISATDWYEGGWNLNESYLFVKELQKIGVDLIDCSSGGMVSGAKVPVGPGYQVQFSEKIKQETGVLTGAVGLITDPVQAETILTQNRADVVFIGRELLRNPQWPIQAALALEFEIEWPKQYLRAK